MLFTCNLVAGELSITLPFTITQDPHGFIWVGTQTHALRYDGHKKIKVAADIGYINRIITTNNTTYISGDKAIVAIDQQLNQQTIYTAKHDNNIVDLTLHKNKLYALQQSKLTQLSSLSGEVTTKQVLSFKRSTRGFVASNNNQVCIVIHAKQYQCIDDSPENKPSETLYFPDTVVSMINHSNKLYFSTKHALYVKASPTDDLILVANFSNQNLSVIAAANQPNHLWLMVNSQPILFNIANKKIIEHNFVRNNQSKVMSIFQSSDSTLWLAANKLEKIAKSDLNIKKITGLNNTSGMAWLMGNSIFSTVFDIKGAYKLNTKTFEAAPLKHVNDVTKGYWYAAHETNFNTWVGGYYGLFENDYRFSEITNRSNLIAKQPVQCIRQVTFETIAVCVDKVGVYLINTNSYESKLVIANDDLGSVVDVLPINEKINQAWIATDRGVFYYNNKNLAQYLPESHVIRLATNKDTLMVATLDDGLFSLTKHGKAINIEKISLPSLGLRINDIKFYKKNLYVTTSLGIAKYNTETKQVNTWPLNKSVGRINEDFNNFNAISTNGELITWANNIQKEATFKSNILISDFSVNGINKPLAELISDGSYIELRVSTNDYSNPEHHEFRMKVNNNPWSDFSDNNTIGFLPKLGINTIKIEANANMHLSRTFTFTVIIPWYLSRWAIALYFVFFLACIFKVIGVYVGVRREIVALNDQHFKDIELINSKHSKDQQLAKQAHKRSLKRGFEKMHKRQDNFFAELSMRKHHKTDLDYKSICADIDNVIVLMEEKQNSKAKRELETTACLIHVDNSLRAPDVLFNSDILGTTQRLAVSQQSKKQYLNINIENIGISKKIASADKEVYSIMYKCIYELLIYLTEKTPAINIGILFYIEQNKLCVAFEIEETELSIVDFNMDSVNLYLVRVLIGRMKGNLSVKSKSDNCKIIMVMPMLKQKKIKNIERKLK